MEQSLYLMLDSKGTPIARGRVQGGTGGQYWQIQVEDGKIDEILEHKKLKLLSVMDTGPSYEGVIVRTDHSLQVGEQVEVVIPVTAQPLVVRCQILRMRPTERASYVLYAAKFLELCNDEETMLREAVFNLQLRGRPKPAGPGA